MNYGFEYQGKVFGPDGLIEPKPDDTRIYNEQLEAKEIAWLKTGPERAFLYVQHTGNIPAFITTWLGTKVAENAWFGERVYVGFGYNTNRRSVSCRIFGVLYHGWYMESSGNYCRLKKAKRQS